MGVSQPENQLSPRESSSTCIRESIPSAPPRNLSVGFKSDSLRKIDQQETRTPSRCFKETSQRGGSTTKNWRLLCMVSLMWHSLRSATLHRLHQTRCADGFSSSCRTMPCNRSHSPGSVRSVRSTTLSYVT